MKNLIRLSDYSMDEIKKFMKSQITYKKENT